MTGIWKRWMISWCYLTLLFGLVLVLIALPPLDAGARWFYRMTCGLDPDTAIFDQPVLRIAAAVQGALTIGWILTVLLLVKSQSASHPHTQAQLWRAITAGLITWFVIDSTISVALGFPLNAAANTLFAATFLVPVERTGVLRTQDQSPQS